MEDSSADATEAALDTIRQRVRSAQRHNLLLKTSVLLLPIGGCLGGSWLQGSYDGMANAWLLFGGLGVGVAVALLKKFERPIPDLD